jgi:hypothetical protein
MIKVSSRFLAVLMLAVLAFTDVTTTSAFAQRVIFRPAPELRIRPPGHVDVPWRLDHGGRIFGEHSWPGETCNLRCESRKLRVDPSLLEENSQSEGVLRIRPYRSPDPVLR